MPSRVLRCLRWSAPLLLPAAIACSAPPADTPATAESPVAITAAVPPAWARSATLYEVNIRQFTPEGTFAAAATHLPRLDSLGVDILWLMPVQPIGVKNRKGGLGSYYSIRDYRAVNPEHGTLADAKAYVAAAHALGQRVILDWVPNHTAFDHPWITAHPDWYTRKPTGEISYPLDESGKETDWTDVAELNYDNADMRRAMIEDMRFWVDSVGIDGFRCDVAWGVPEDFWPQVREALATSRADLFFLAEAERPSLHDDFHMTYGWEFHHLLNRIAQGKAPVDSIDAYLAAQAARYPAGAMRMYFTSNHDENSWQGTEFERMGANHVPAFVVAATMAQGMPLLYTGQEVSLGKRLRFFEKDTVDWRGPSLADFYRSMFALKHDNTALWNGADGGPQQRLALDGASRVYAYTRTKGENTVLVAVNFGDTLARVTYRDLPAPGTFTDWQSKATQRLDREGSLEIPAHGYRVLVR